MATNINANRKPANSFSVVDASISELSHALSNESLTAVDLLTKYLRRISRYDCRGTLLNSIPVLNPKAFNEAAASDDRRAAGESLGVLDGIPYTVKDSYRVKDMTISNGAWAFRNLMANEDAFMVSQFRSAGAVLLGRTNMCPMAAGGMQRGVFGRAENPYNLDYLAAAFASGSSNGSGASTAASLAAFGLGSETVSSGRSPASNNSLIAYNPSKGFLSVRGVWPLYPTCDTVTPHARSMQDLLSMLDVMSVEDKITKEDFWRDQSIIKMPSAWQNRPKSFTSLAQEATLLGKRIVVPEMYIGGRQLEVGPPVTTAPETIALWEQARKDLEAAGATVVVVPDFPIVQEYVKSNTSSSAPASTPVHLPANWNTIERSVMIAHAWEEFLKTTNDPNLNTIVGIEPSKLFPQYTPEDPHMAYNEPLNQIHWAKLGSIVEQAASTPTPIYSIPNLSEALHALEDMRTKYFESWLVQQSADFVVFPAVGDVGRADADVDHKSAEYAWRNGVKYSNGIRALRHLGIPGVTVPMGILEGKGVPMGLTFLGPAGSDVEILKVACAYEKASQHRIPPGLTPTLETDWIHNDGQKVNYELPRAEITVAKCVGKKSSEDSNRIQVEIEGNIKASTTVKTASNMPGLEIFIDGEAVAPELIQLSAQGSGEYGFDCTALTSAPMKQDERNQVDAKIPRDSTMIVLVARSGANGRPSGCLKLIHQSEYTE